MFELWLLRQFYLDVVGVGEEHGDTIDAHPPAGCRWQSVLQSRAEGLIDEHGFIITLSFGLENTQLQLLTCTNIHTYIATTRSLDFYKIKQCNRNKK